MATKTSEEKAQMQRFVLEKLKIPKTLILTHMAILNHSEPEGAESAIQNWLLLGNYNDAHSLFMEHLAPIYFGTQKALDLLKLQKVHGNRFVKTQEREMIDTILLQLSQSRNIPNWHKRGSILLDTLNLFDQFEEFGPQSTLLPLIHRIA